MEFVKIDNNFKDKEKLYSLNDEAFPKEERTFQKVQQLL